MRGALKSFSFLMRNFHLSGLDAKPSHFSPLCSFIQRAARDDRGSPRIQGRCLSSSSSSPASSSVVETLLEYESDQHCDNGKVMEKEATLQLALSQLAGDFDRESQLSLHRFSRARYVPVVSTGSLKLDLAIGIGGLPKGRIVEIYGREASGKTTLALHIVKEAQKLGGCCAYVDVENALNHSFAEGMGVNTENLLIIPPTSAENSLSIVNTLINSGSVNVIVVDSVAALSPQCELDGVIDINSQDIQSRLMSQALRKVHHSLKRSQTIVIFTNQVRSNLRNSGALRQEHEVTCGGNALKFYSTVRLRITRRNLLHNEDKITGISISVQVMKNKLAPLMKNADLNIEFGRGLCHEAEVLEIARKHGIVTGEDGYSIQGKFFRSQTEAEEYLAENSDVANKLVTELREQLFEPAANNG